MKKIIDIPEYIVKDLKKLAVDENVDLKNYIQNKLIKIVELSKVKYCTCDKNTDGSQNKICDGDCLFH